LGKGEPMSPEAREHSFDELAKGLATGTLSRGKAIRWMGGALLQRFAVTLTRQLAI
jgi:hypothetical protein